MKITNFSKWAQAIFIAALASGVWAGTWAPGIVIDGAFDDWEGQVPALITDPSGDGGSGRDVKAIYLANDSTYLYVRIESYNTNIYDGNEFSGIDGDNSSATGYDLFGAGLGSDTLVAGAYVYGQKTDTFNSGDGSPKYVDWLPYGNVKNIEYRIRLDTTIPGDITKSFPNGLGSTIKFLFGDANGGAGDICGPALYTLATTQPAVAVGVIEDFNTFDTNDNAMAFTRDASTAGCSAERASNSRASGDYALSVIHSVDTVGWHASLVARRYAQPRSIAGHTNMSIEVYGNPSASGRLLWVGLVDRDGTYYATVVPFPTQAEWTTIVLGPTTTWWRQTLGADGELDLTAIVEWRVGMQNPNTGGSSGNFTAAYDNLTAIHENVQDVVFAPLAGDVPNPDRGVYRHGGDITDTNIDYEAMAASGYRLVYNLIKLDNYTSSTIPQTYLEAIANGFSRIRNAGMKSLIRITYNDGFSSDPPTEASPTYLQTHLAQLQPILEANKDVIAYTYAGIIGAWGEWHSTYYYRDESLPYHQYNEPSAYWRRQVIDWLLQYLPNNQFVLIRRPGWKDPASGAEALFPGEQVDEETAFTTAGVARVGHHNDAFLASADDLGTYDADKVEDQKNFLATDTQYVPMGGETALYDSNYLSCTTCVAEMARLHWSFFNEDHETTAVNTLKAEGCWDTIKRSLGYRFVLTSATLPSIIRHQEPFYFAFKVRNDGNAPAYKWRPVYLVVTDANNGHAVAVAELSGVDIRRWKPGETYSYAFTMQVDLPSPPPTDMGLALWLPDESTSLRDRPDYSVRFANFGVWDPTHGWNVLISGGIALPVQLSQFSAD